MILLLLGLLALATGEGPKPLSSTFTSSRRHEVNYEAKFRLIVASSTFDQDLFIDFDRTCSSSALQKGFENHSVLFLTPILVSLVPCGLDAPSTCMDNIPKDIILPVPGRPVSPTLIDFFQLTNGRKLYFLDVLQIL